ncbi:MAG TPA: PF20097 family protein [Verrucomicrobiae bacterium]|nr:PF20097 family protein [Verrucomicrobiae bacterium]
MRPNCAKCGKEMETGFVIDRGHGNFRNLPIWVSGAPEHSFWKGLKTGERANLEVCTYRCPACGLLESYAIKPAT